MNIEKSEQCNNWYVEISHVEELKTESLSRL